MKEITVADYTLKQLADEGAPLLFREKMALIKCIDATGNDVIELPPISRKREDAIVCRMIAETAKNTVLSIAVKPDEDGIKEAYQVIEAAKTPMLSIELPTSTLAMEYTFHMKNDKMLSLIDRLVRAAASICSLVEFSAQDAFSADREFLVRALLQAEAAGATSLCICQGKEQVLPFEVEELVRYCKASVTRPLSIRVSDKSAMATALAVYAIRGGIDGIKSAICGKHTLSTEKLDMIMKDKGDLLGVTCHLETTHITTDIHHWLDDYSKSNEQKEKESGKRSFDSHTTPAEAAEAVRTLGYVLSDDDNENVYTALLTLCEKKGAVDEREFEALIASHASSAPAVYLLDSYNISSSNLSASMANVVLERDGVKLSGLSTGDGPIDAAFRAIENALGFRYDLDDFRIQAVTEGKEALGSAVVKLRSDGRVFSGNGVSSDIVGASVAAYINALNRIVGEEVDRD